MRIDNRIFSNYTYLKTILFLRSVKKVPYRRKAALNHKIVLITPFLDNVNDDNAEMVIAKINEMGMDLIVISDDLEYDNSDAEDHGTGMIKMAFTQSETKTQSQLKSEKLIEKIVGKTNGVFSNFADAVLQLSYLPSSKVNAAPWHCPLQIGEDLRINISAFLYITRETLKSFKTESIDPDTSVSCAMHFMMNGKVVPNLDRATTIDGYVYGDRIVPVDKCLNTDLNAGEKSFLCIGFSHRKYLLEEYFSGKSTYLMVPQATCEQSIRMLNSLGTVMIENEMVMIGRRVRQLRGKPTLYALFPMRHDEYQSIYFHMIELIFAENKLEFYFPDLTAKKYQPNEDQVAAIDSLIDSMNLMTADDGMEAFDMDRTLNPSKQFMYRVISARAMDPSLPLPKFSEDLAKMCEIPEQIKEQSKEAMDRVKEQFLITEKEVSKKQKWMKKNLAEDITDNVADNAKLDQLNKEAQALSLRKTITEIGSLTPMEDFDALFRGGEKFSVLCIQLQNILVDLIFNSMSWEFETEKISKAMMYYREQSKTIGAHYYNDWVEGFKAQLLIRNNLEFFNDVIVKEQLGIISMDESETSIKTVEDVKAFYNTTSLTKKATVEDSVAAADDDLFDDM